MASETVRSTIYLDAGLHRALRLKAATNHRSISEIVNDAVRAALHEDGEEQAPLAIRAGQQIMSYEKLLARLKVDLRPALTRGTPAEELIEHFRHLPHVDPVQFRADIDSILDASL